MKKILTILGVLIALNSYSQISTRCVVCPAPLNGVPDGYVLTDSSGHAVWKNVAGFDTTAIGVDSLNNLYWGLNGNAGTNPSTDFIGTTDDIDFLIKRNGVEQIDFTSGAIKMGFGIGSNIQVYSSLDLGSSLTGGFLNFYDSNQSGFTTQISAPSITSNRSIGIPDTSFQMVAGVAGNTAINGFINFSNPAAGNILTSDASGNAQWSQITSSTSFDLSALPQYANNAAALSGGLTAGQIYIDNSWHITVVH
jgi:hypothetical protein